ncbi:MAG: 4Fe-4S dicluster domain-containing protein [Dehalococcoidia bacterium]
MNMGFYFDQTRCTGCYTCAVACKDWHDISAGPASRRQVSTLETGRFPEVSVAFLVTSCYHCARPSCAGACPVGAITKRPQDGIMVVDKEKCLGGDKCDMCLRACPYDVPQFGDGDNPKMDMCDFCLERLAGGQEPVCVESCPMRALDSGPVEELTARYGSNRQAQGFAYSAETGPAVLFNPKE